MEKPSPVIWIKRIFLVRVILFGLSLVIAVIALFLVKEKGVFTSLADLIFSQRNLENPYFDPRYSIGYLIGSFGVYALLILLQYLFLIRRKKLGFWVVFAFDLLMTIAGARIPFLQVIVLILGLNTETSTYFDNQVAKQ